MKPHLKAIVFFILALVALVSAGVIGFSSFKAIFSSSQTLATWEGPGTTNITLEEAGLVTVWHDYQTMMDGVTVRNEMALPGGIAFEAKRQGSNATIAMSPATGNQTTSFNNVRKVAVGSFDLPRAGDYEITVSGPANGERIYSVSEGSLFSSFGRAFVTIVSCGLLVVLAFIFGVMGVISLFNKKNSPKTSATLNNAS